MVLQPLVENAIVHAVEPLSRPVKVQVSFTRLKTRLLIEVIDDGVGMDPGTLKALNSGNLDLNNSNGGLGLRNVIRRLQLDYGNQFHLRVKSEMGHGTHIMLTLPISE
jgi:sensor histidine kinase YesM